MSKIDDSVENKDNEISKMIESRPVEALKQLFCGGVSGSAAKTVTAPFSRLAILFQVHSMVTTKENRPKFAMSTFAGAQKIIGRGGYLALWKGNGTSVIHRFPYSAINFYCYENTLDFLVGERTKRRQANGDDDDDSGSASPLIRFIAGASAGSTACIACYPLDLVRTRLITELPGREHYKGIVDAFSKIISTEGFFGLYSGLGPTLFVAVPNFAISYSTYGTLKEYVLDDEKFYNLRKVDMASGEERLGFRATLLCGASSGMLSSFITYPFDTIRRRMQIQNLHVEKDKWLTARQHIVRIASTEGFKGLYRGLTPELMKVIPMVGTMFTCYEYLKRQLRVGEKKRNR
mmetsp:Transcript_40493/g.47391  ORF Transcript_40493/g.47391 Transcript_40493/m.47391 type:complete len:348 (-) Transcript_40493:640-1683(-)